MSRRRAAFSLWALSGVFALGAFGITVTSKAAEQVIAGAGIVLWLVLFFTFSWTSDY